MSSKSKGSVSGKDEWTKCKPLVLWEEVQQNFKIYSLYLPLKNLTGKWHICNLLNVIVCLIML